MPKTPTRGALVVASLTAEMKDNDLEPDASDLALLDLIRSTADRLEQLEQIAEKEGLTINTGKTIRVHPAVVEARSLSLTLSRLIGQIDTTSAASGVNPVKRRAANRRWELEHARRGGASG